MAQWQAIIPLDGIDLSEGQRVEFAGGLTLGTMPNWISNDPWLKALSGQDQYAIKGATHGFIAPYEAERLNSPDPTWKYPGEKPISEVKHGLAMLANLALWLSHPSPAHLIHALYADVTDSYPQIKGSQPFPRIFPHAKDSIQSPSAEDIELARRLHLSIAQLERKGSIWSAVQATWVALQMNTDIIRYPLFWMALESLFGPEQAAGEITYKLSQRIAFFLAEDRSKAREIYKKAKDGYSFRSTIVHGRWKEKKESQTLLAEVETLARESLLRLLLNEDLLKVFASKNRDAYLDDLVFEGFDTAS
jgi:hypothetical protein